MKLFGSSLWELNYFECKRIELVLNKSKINYNGFSSGMHNEL